MGNRRQYKIGDVVSVRAVVEFVYEQEGNVEYRKFKRVLKEVPLAEPKLAWVTGYSVRYSGTVEPGSGLKNSVGEPVLLVRYRTGQREAATKESLVEISAGDPETVNRYRWKSDVWTDVTREELRASAGESRCPKCRRFRKTLSGKMVQGKYIREFRCDSCDRR